MKSFSSTAGYSFITHEKKLREISAFYNCHGKNSLPLVYAKERNLDPNHTIFENSASRYTYTQEISQFCDLACSTFCMVLHGFLVDSLLSHWVEVQHIDTIMSVRMSNFQCLVAKHVTVHVSVDHAGHGNSIQL